MLINALKHLRRMMGLIALCSWLAGATTAGAQQSANQENRPDRPSQEARLADNTAVTANVPYGDDDLQRLDIYAPKRAAQAPVVVFVHGGEWTRGDKSAVSFKPRLFNERGMLFVSVNYRLSPAATHPAHVSDVAAALAWVREHAQRFGGDPKKIYLIGHSAGCHLVTLVALDARYLAKVGMRPADLAGVVAWSGGSFDLVQKVEQGGAYADYIKQAFGDSKQAWSDASPVNHIDNANAGPPFLFASVESGSASHQAAERLAGLIRQAGGRATTKLLEGRDHFGANHFLGAPDDTTAAMLLEFIAAPR